MSEELDKFRRINDRRVEVDEPAQVKRYQDQSRARLLRILRKKHSTTFIGDLARFESHFGHLWGHGREDTDRTPEQKAWFDIWQLCRNEVLNNGNNQLRAVESEVAQYTITWNRNQYTLPVMPREGL